MLRRTLLAKLALIPWFNLPDAAADADEGNLLFTMLLERGVCISGLRADSLEEFGSLEFGVLLAGSLMQESSPDERLVTDGARRSTSVGDVVEIDGTRYAIEPVGFKPLAVPSKLLKLKV